MYESQQKKIDEVKQNLIIINEVTSTQGPNGSFTTCIIRSDILKRIGAQLNDYLKHLEYVMDKEMST